MSKHSHDAGDLVVEAATVKRPRLAPEVHIISSDDESGTSPSVLAPDVSPHPINFDGWLNACNSEINATYSSRQMSDALVTHISSNVRHVLTKIMTDCAFHVDWSHRPQTGLHLRFDGQYNTPSHTTTMNALQTISVIAKLIPDCKNIELRNRLLLNRVMEDIQSAMEAILECMKVFAPAATAELMDGRLGKGLMARLEQLEKVMSEDREFGVKGYKELLTTAKYVQRDARARSKHGNGRTAPVPGSMVFVPGRGTAPSAPISPVSFDYLSKSCWKELYITHKRLRQSQQYEVAGDVARVCDSAFETIMKGCGYPEYRQYKVVETAIFNERPVAVETIVNGIETMRKIAKSICLMDPGEIQKWLRIDGCVDHLAGCLLVLSRSLERYDPDDIRPLVNDGKDGGLAERLKGIARWMKSYSVKGYDEVVAEVQRYT